MEQDSLSGASAISYWQLHTHLVYFSFILFLSYSLFFLEDLLWIWANGPEYVAAALEKGTYGFGEKDFYFEIAIMYGLHHDEVCTWGEGLQSYQRITEEEKKD